jgi:hydrogenase nickel incorporation protein HypA/HybF
MHELALAEEIVAIVCQRAGSARIKRVVVEIGKLAAVLPDALRFGLEISRENTTAHSAQFEIIETPGEGRCRRCNQVNSMHAPLTRCACGSTDLDWLNGEELKIKEMELM